VITHPDFQRPGTLGIRNAQDFALALITGYKDMTIQAHASGAPAPEVLDVKNWLNKLQIVVRNIDL